MQKRNLGKYYLIRGSVEEKQSWEISMQPLMSKTTMRDVWDVQFLTWVFEFVGMVFRRKMDVISFCGKRSTQLRDLFPAYNGKRKTDHSSKMYWHGVILK